METTVGIGALTAAVGGLGAELWLYMPVLTLMSGMGKAPTEGAGLAVQSTMVPVQLRGCASAAGSHPRHYRTSAWHW